MLMTGTLYTNLFDCELVYSVAVPSNVNLMAL